MQSLSCLTRALALAGGLLGCLPAALAQGGGVPLSGSEQYLSAGAHLASGGGGVASATYDAEVNLGSLLSPGPAASANYQVQSATLSLTEALVPAAPYVVGVQPDHGPAQGGTVVDVYGMHFASPGGGTPAIQFGLLPGSGVNVLSNTHLQVTTPSGFNQYGNPYGVASVQVTNNFGSNKTDQAWWFGPALRTSDAAEVGGSYGLQFVGDAGSFHFVYLGLSQPGVAVPIGGIAGQLELISDVQLLVKGAADGSGNKQYSLPVPDKPTLEGVVVDLQAIAVEANPAVSLRWTNRIPVQI